MTLQEKYMRAKELVSGWKQEHLLQYYDELSGDRKESLLNDILGTDFSLVCGLFEQANIGMIHDISNDEINPAKITDKSRLTFEELNSAFSLGMVAVKAGRYAVVTMAGGQGTRLGYDGPKGTYRIDLGEEVTLFEVQLRYINKLSREAGKTVPWYIMTSDENHVATLSFFDRNGYFGYPDILFFKQGSLPMVGFDGKILLEEKHKLKEGPDGNGSIFSTMDRTGIAEDMRQRGIEWFFVSNVDNILSRCDDPLPIGLAIQRNTLCVSKSVLKKSPEERAGVFCLKDGHPSVIEYTELSAELAYMNDNSGQYAYGDLHISCTLFNIDVLQLEGALHMPYHMAVKKASHIDIHGKCIVPEQPNANKFEAFIFDIFPNLNNMIILRVPREEEFAPIKNAKGEDSPKSARELYMKCFK